MKTSNNKIKKHILSLTKFAVVNQNNTLYECLKLISKKGIGIACVTNNTNKLIGVVTDGDIRRMILNINKPISAFFNDSVYKHMNRKPFSILDNCSIKKALQIIEQKQIWDLPVINSKKELIGLLHLHPLAKYLNEKNK